MSLHWNSIDVQSFLKFNDISPAVQSHLIRVYVALLFTVLSCAVGVFVNMRFHLSSYSFAWFFASLGALYWIRNDSGNRLDYYRRTASLCVFGLLQGISIGSLVEIALFVNPSIVLTAALATAAIFGCFSLSALVAKRRSYLYLGGIIGSALAILSLLSLSNIFLRSASIFGAQLYGGLIVFCGCVILDTQLIIEKASAGNHDFANHALELFSDVLSIFVRVLVILLRNKEKKSEKRR